MNKKIFLVVLFCCTAFSLFAKQPENPPYDETKETSEIIGTVTVLSVSSTSIELLIEASDALNDFCNYFENSWADVGISLYCTFAGTGVYGECIIYKAFKAMCGINGVVRLTMEGDISNAIKRGIKTGTQIYSIVKQSQKAFALSELMCRSDYEKNK